MSTAPSSLYDKGLSLKASITSSPHDTNSIKT